MAPPAPVALRWHRRHAGLAAAAAAVGAIGGPRPAAAIVEEFFTTNAICSQRHCVNPVFPALEDLPGLDAARWQKLGLANVSQFMGFCGKVVDYDPAVRVPDPQTAGGSSQERAQRARERHAEGLPVRDSDLKGPADPTQDSVAQADRAAARRYFLHLSGMGVEAWEHADPMEASSHPLRECARSVARMVCFTYFPKAPAHLQQGEEVTYVRPCRSSCESFLQACRVECCDESLTCVWGGAGAASSPGGAGQRRTQAVGGRTVLLDTGYVNASAPSPLCTG